MVAFYATISKGVLEEIAEDQESPKKITRGNVMRSTFQEFKKKALADPQVEKEYRKLSPAYALRKQLVKIRKGADLLRSTIFNIAIN